MNSEDWMMVRYTRALLVAAIMVTTSLHAQAAADTVHKLSGSGDFGFVNTSGNTEVTTLNAGEQLSYAPTKHFHATQSVAVVYGKTDGEESANLWQATARGDQDLGNAWGAYALVDFDRNTFASIDRRFQEGLGVLYHPVRTATDTLATELGLGLVEQRSTSDSSSTQPIARAAGRYRHSFAAKAYGEEQIEILPDLQHGKEFRVNSSTDLVAPLFKTLALKASYVINFDNDPEPGRRKSDRFLTTGVQLSF
jgi:putative salt-induced outer membrane protein YdiY